ncbi:MAG: hypothetical protein WB626_13190 [Bacteroidota bacterium]
MMLMVIGIVLVGVMIAIGVWMFIDQSSATNRDQISNDLVQYAAQAQKYYRRPSVLGGGNNSFGGLTLGRITSEPVNANGTYALSPDPSPPSASFVTITGVGIETGTDGSTPVHLTMTVWSDSILIVADN